MLEWFRSIDWETVGGLALIFVVGGLLKYGLDCVRYDMKYPSRRYKGRKKRPK